MHLKTGLNEGSGKYTHRYRAYGNNVSIVEPGNLIGFTGKPVTFNSRVIEKNRVCKGAYKGEEICYMRGKSFRLHNNLLDSV